MVVDDQSVLEIIDIDGEKKKVEVVLTLALEQTNKEYIIYTLNQKSNDLVVLYASEIRRQNGEVVLENILDNEWLLVKNKMQEIIQDKKESC